MIARNDDKDLAYFMVMVCYFDMLPLSITQIIFGSYQNNYPDCDSFLRISDWLLVQGCTAISTFIFALLLYNFTSCGALEYTDAKRKRITYFRYILHFLLLWQCLWINIGSVMFWNNCRHITSSINDLMWSSLIIGHIFYVGSFLFIVFGEKAICWFCN